MAGGHLDSVAGGPGINDNGSGAALLIEAAEAIGSKPPGARVRLGFWGAEELGLVGSRHYVDALDHDEVRRIRAYLNFDMVGSPNPRAELYGDGDASLVRLLRRIAAPARLGMVEASGSSDHMPFDLAGIPVNGLYTGGTERGRGGRPRDACYHLACDSARRVDRPVLVRMARVAAEALRTLSAQAK
jgi:aminopeptidase S